MSAYNTGVRVALEHLDLVKMADWQSIKDWAHAPSGPPQAAPSNIAHATMSYGMPLALGGLNVALSQPENRGWAVGSALGGLAGSAIGGRLGSSALGRHVGGFLGPLAGNILGGMGGGEVGSFVDRLRAKKPQPPTEALSEEEWNHWQRERERRRPIST